MNTNFEIIIKPTKGIVPLDLKELWQYRGLVSTMILREVQGKYRQSILGFAWAFIPLFIQMIVFTIIFGRVADLGPQGTPYPIFSYAALLPWAYFSRALEGASGSLLKQSGILTKVYFPRLTIPLVGVISALVDFAVGSILMVVLMVWYQVIPGWEILLLPFFVFITMMTALGVGLWLTALGVRYRDVNFITPFFLQIWMYLTPVIFAVDKIPEKYQIYLWLNPMTGVIEGFRWALIGNTELNWQWMGISYGMIALIFLSGLYYFKSMEKTFADII